MGVYLNPGKANFQMSLNSEIFVDKSGMIEYINSIINTESRFVSVSRPRRFGKTMAMDMLCAYYDHEADSRDMFASLKIATTDSDRPWDEYLGAFDVIKIVMTRFFKTDITVRDALSKMQSLVIRDIKKAYPDADYYDDTNLIQTIEDVYAYNNRQVIFLIDEWDAPFRERPDDKDGHKEFLDYLRDLLKNNEYVALAYMTGILPIKKYGKHSALNMFTEYSMIRPRNLAEYVGFTSGEVKKICDERRIDYEAMKSWYDGYRIGGRQSAKVDGEDTAEYYEIYCPLSVVNAARFVSLENYWNKTETYEALAEYIRRDYDGLKEAVMILMNGGRIIVDTSTYQNDMTTFYSRDDILSLLIHLGYLGYDEDTSEVFIPNKEILDEFKTSTKSKEWNDSFRAYDLSLELLKATWDKNDVKVARLIEKAHDRSGNKTYNDEAALSYAIRYAYYAAEQYYTTILELDTGKGYADIVYLPSPKYPDKPAMLVELKYDKDAYTAISQIKEKDYPARLEHYKGNILLVGINYDKQARNDNVGFKHHTCVIESA